jgi:alkylated DNA repair dioxygenase AlkB
MISIIKTKTSALNLYNIDDICEKTIVEECVGEVKDKLIVNPPIIVYAKPSIQHRSIGFFSDTSIGYKYSNQLAKSIALTPKLTTLLELINKKFKSDFNGILVNKYNDGNDYIGAHSDDETNLDNIGVISISYGAIRKFRIRDKTTRKIVKDIPTNPFQIMHMAGKFQKEFIHEIPIEKKVKGERYSFTFRKHLK